MNDASIDIHRPECGVRRGRTCNCDYLHLKTAEPRKLPSSASTAPETLPSEGSTASKPSSDSAVDHPLHYGGRDNPYEAIKVIEAWGLGFLLGNTVKYIARVAMGTRRTMKKDLEDLQKARWYLDRHIQYVERVVETFEEKA